VSLTACNAGAPAPLPPPAFGACGDPATRIHLIQGAGTTAALTGSRTIEGVVVGDYQGAGQFNGYFIQEEVADQDADPLTSEGIFVFSGSGVDNVSAGDVVRVRVNVDPATQSVADAIAKLKSMGFDPIIVTP